MNAYTVTSKGQITLRKDLLNHLGVQAGEKINVEKLPDGGIKITARKASGEISDVFRLFKHDGPTLSIEEMNETIAKGWAGEL
jgi:bifunctional DNA-binding transcriptional regulator/antitoxin component of YhaV-PrlF toxin-antitoxin module